ncbi:MFS transporter [Ruminococcus sp. CLA-AA-H200]|uniref:MFS transporter n=1 Tax=Ruminococcus turbiniformis TaxID=2881258 RepID=A0ABS8FUG2_9FIRM|nr:MFS transporter [Ruminococcus turbiniformis]MCC2253675.1 MFS transporter [Ruminococcus turbiniformis]
MNNSKIKGKYAYALGMISYNAEYLVVSYLSYALTNSYGLSAIISGSIFLFSRLFDGVTDVIAGIVIDRLNPKMGKARVYDLLHVPLWVCLVLVFSVPDVGLTAKIIWVFVFYNLLQSGIATFMNIAEPLRLQRSFREDARVQVMKITSMASTLFSFLVSFTLPVLIDRFASRPHGWTIISMIFAVPFAICGLCRFFLLPELPEEQNSEEKKEKITLFDSLKALFQNKYALLYGGVMICWAMYNTMSAGNMTYYFQFVYGDIKAQSIMSFPTLFTLIFIAVIPKFIEKGGKVNTLRIGLFMAMICQAAKLLMPTNIVWLVLMQFVSTCGIMALSFMKPLMTIDCMTYGKWKTGNSVEAAYSTVNSLSDKLGLGLGSFALGAILELGGYDGMQAVQSASAVFTIKMLFTLIPAALMAIGLLCLAFYNLEKRLPQIEKELKEK